MKWRNLLASMLSLLLPALAHSGTAEWLTSYTNVLQAAKQEQKPVLVQFTAEWCHYCKQMEKSTLQEQAAIAAMQPYLLLRLDYDKETALVRHFGIQGVPAFIVLDQSGDEAARTAGFQPSADFSKWLKESEDAVRKQNYLRERLAVERRQLDAALSSRDEAGLKSAAETVFQWAGMEKIETKNLARDYLLRLVEVKPLLVLEGADHPSLAIRIAASNALQRKYGEAFSLDPWADRKLREKESAAFRHRLSAVGVSP